MAVTETKGASGHPVTKAAETKVIDVYTPSGLLWALHPLHPHSHRVPLTRILKFLSKDLSISPVSAVVQAPALPCWDFLQIPVTLGPAPPGLSLLQLSE